MSENMTIPEGLSCGDCELYPKCSSIIGVKQETTECDFFPVKFRPSSIMFAAYKKDCATLLSANNALERQLRYNIE